MGSTFGEGRPHLVLSSGMTMPSVPHFAGSQLSNSLSAFAANRKLNEFDMERSAKLRTAGLE